MFDLVLLLFRIYVIHTLVVLNVLSIIFCRLLNLFYIKFIGSDRSKLLDKFLSNLIFAFELHLNILFIFYYFVTSTGGVFMVLSIFIALYYFAAWNAEYCQSQYLTTHYVKLTTRFFANSDICKSKGNILFDYLFVVVEVAFIVLIFSPLSKFLLESYFLGPCGKADLECLVCQQYRENVWMAGVLEFLGAFLVGAAVNEFEGMPLVVLSTLYRLVLYPILTALGHDLIFIHVLPVTAISYFVFCWDHFQYPYLVAHWFSPFLGSFAGWLFFHQQYHSGEDYVKTSVTSLAGIQSKDTPSQTPLCNKVTSQIPQTKSLQLKKTKSAIPKPTRSGVCQAVQSFPSEFKRESKERFYNQRPIEAYETYPETCHYRFPEAEYCSYSCSPSSDCVCNFEEPWSESHDMYPCDCGYCDPIRNFHNNTCPYDTSSGESTNQQLQSRRNSCLFFKRLKLKVRETVGSMNDKLASLCRSLTGRTDRKKLDSATCDLPSDGSFTSDDEKVVVLPATWMNYSRRRLKSKRFNVNNRNNQVYSNYSANLS